MINGQLLILISLITANKGTIQCYNSEITLFPI